MKGHRWWASPLAMLVCCVPAQRGTHLVPPGLHHAGKDVGPQPALLLRARAPLVGAWQGGGHLQNGGPEEVQGGEPGMRLIKTHSRAHTGARL